MNPPALQSVAWRLTASVGAEIALITGAVVVGLRVALGDAGWQASGIAGVLPNALLVGIVAQLCVYQRNVRGVPSMALVSESSVRILQVFGASALILGALYLYFPQLVISPPVFLGAAGLSFVLIVAWRATLDWTERHVLPRTRLLFVGTTPIAVALAEELSPGTDGRVEVVGFVEAESLPGRSGAGSVLGTLEDLPAIVRARSVDRVIIGIADARGTLPMQQLLDMKLGGVRFEHLATLYEEMTGRLAVEHMRPSYLVFSSGFERSAWFDVVKRIMDVAGAAAGLVLSAPLMAIVALVVRITSRGPVLYEQPRVGQFGRIFLLRKFRSMRVDAEAGSGAVWAAADDPRTTPLGKLLRKSHLDELPQLWNVLQGHMSLIGPRPERPEFVRTLAQTLPMYEHRHVIRPGLTGWAQVSQAYSSTIDESFRKLQYDLFYIKHRSLLLDLRVALRTVKQVVQGNGV